VLQQHEVTPVGSSRPEVINVQVVAATNRDLELEVAEGRFREDLYYRLNMVEFQVPALRQRIDDIPHFVDFFSRKFAARYGRPLWKPTDDTLRQFCEYRWPGNVRQLANIIEQAYVLECEPRVPERLETRKPADATLPLMDLSQLRRMAVRQALRATQGHKGRAARLLGVHPNTMTRLLAQIRGEEAKEHMSDGEIL